ncbi:hypothetical protein [Alicyclobacillus suci]|uniref:hypothetical protein n=1 Tax=Alicyclobacillus suci TaxID=2816080 RepID=UPI001A8CB8CA|nr:hypothetical protein [Alicyclobacillus suci]
MKAQVMKMAWKMYRDACAGSASCKTMEYFAKCMRMAWANVKFKVKAEAEGWKVMQHGPRIMIGARWNASTKKVEVLQMDGSIVSPAQARVNEKNLKITLGVFDFNKSRRAKAAKKAVDSYSREVYERNMAFIQAKAYASGEYR